MKNTYETFLLQKNISHGIKTLRNILFDINARQKHFFSFGSLQNERVIDGNLQSNHQERPSEIRNVLSGSMSCSHSLYVDVLRWSAHRESKPYIYIYVYVYICDAASGETQRKSLYKLKYMSVRDRVVCRALSTCTTLVQRPKYDFVLCSRAGLTIIAQNCAA